MIIKINVKIKVVILFFILFFSVPLNSKIQKVAYVNAVSGLNVRSGPGIKHNKITTIYFNSKVIILEYSKDKVKIEKITAPWAKIKYNRYSGWVFSGFLSNKILNETETFQIELSKLDPANLDSISKSILIYKKMFNNKQNQKEQDRVYKNWIKFHNNVMENISKDLGYEIKDVNKYRKYGFLIYYTEGTPYLSTDLNFYLKEFSNFLSKSIVDFLRIRAKEKKEGFSDDAMLVIAWDAIRKRIIIWEKYINDYPNSYYNSWINKLIKHYFEVYLSGIDNSPLYEQTKYYQKSNLKLSKSIKESYEAFIKKNKKSRYYSIVKNYYNLLKKNNFIVDYGKINSFLKKNNLTSMSGVQPLAR